MAAVETEKLLAPINDFLACRTPQAWIEVAMQDQNLSCLLIDSPPAERCEI